MCASANTKTCSDLRSVLVESREQIQSIATIVKESGAKIWRAARFKRGLAVQFSGVTRRRTSFPAEAARETGLPVVTEVMTRAISP